MDTKIIQNEMRKLDKISGLDTSNIPIRISSRMVKSYGKCRFQKAFGKIYPTEIIFFRNLIQNGTMEQILETVRHEYAHIFANLTDNTNHKHDYIWKAAALRFGCSGCPRVNYCI